MGKIYQDNAGNRLFINRKEIYAKNRKGFLVNKESVLALMNDARRQGFLKEDIKLKLGSRGRLNGSISPFKIKRDAGLIGAKDKIIPKEVLPKTEEDLLGINIQDEIRID